MGEAYVKSNPNMKKVYEFSRRIIETTEHWTEERMQVFTAETNDYSRIGVCHGKNFSADFKQKLKEDLIIVVQPYNQRSGWFAAAGACYLDSTTGRPVAGALLLNFAYIGVNSMNEYYLPPIFVHEFFHILGFSNYFFTRQGIAKNLTINGHASLY